MIIKKLKQVSGGVFPGAAYNETKVEQGVADFAGAANVDGNFLLVLDMLHEAGVNCAHEVEQYLQDHSNTFGNSKYSSTMPCLSKDGRKARSSL